MFDNLQTADKDFCNLIRIIRDDVRFKECDLKKDELTQLKSDLLTFVHTIAQGSWQKTEHINALATAIKLILTFFA